MSNPLVALSTEKIYAYLKRALRVNKPVFLRSRNLGPRVYIFGDEHACFKKISASSLWGNENKNVVDIFEPVLINGEEHVTFIGTMNFDHVRHFDSMELIMHQIRRSMGIIENFVYFSTLRRCLVLVS